MSQNEYDPSEELSPEEAAAAAEILERVGDDDDAANLAPDTKPDPDRPRPEDFERTPDYDVEAERRREEAEAAEREERKSAPAAKGDDPDAGDGDRNEKIARAMGWAPKEEWRGDPDQWIDADTFVGRSSVPQLIDQMGKMDAQNRETINRLERMNQRALDEQEAKLKAWRKQNLDKAVANKDRAAVDKIEAVYDKEAAALADEKRQSEANLRPEPIKGQEDLQSWAAAHPEFKTDQAFMVVADQELMKIEKAYPDLDTKAQLAKLDNVLAVRFPDLDSYKDFSSDAGDEEPGTKKERRRGGPARQTGGVKVRGSARGGNFASRLPAEARAQAERHVRQGLYKNVEAYAKEYFE